MTESPTDVLTARTLVSRGMAEMQALREDLADHGTHHDACMTSLVAQVSRIQADMDKRAQELTELQRLQEALDARLCRLEAESDAIKSLSEHHHHHHQ